MHRGFIHPQKVANATPSQDSETAADLRNFQTSGFVDDASHWSKVLQLFFSSENEMQKHQKKTHNVLSKMRNNASFQLYAPEDDKTGNMSALLKPADSCDECVVMSVLKTCNQSFPHGRSLVKCWTSMNVLVWTF